MDKKHTIMKNKMSDIFNNTRENVYLMKYEDFISFSKSCKSQSYFDMFVLSNLCQKITSLEDHYNNLPNFLQQMFQHKHIHCREEAQFVIDQLCDKVFPEMSYNDAKFYFPIFDRSLKKLDDINFNTNEIRNYILISKLANTG